MHRKFSNVSTSPRKLCTWHTSERQMMFWSWQHLDSRHERSRNCKEDFVVWVLLSPKWLSLVRLMQSVMRFGGGQVFRKANVSALSVSIVARYAWIWVWKWGPHKFLGILSMLRVSEVCKNKLYSSFTQVSWVICPRSWVEFEYHESLYSNSTHHKSSLYSTQVLKYSL
jgi:hypothetical protein